MDREQAKHICMELTADGARVTNLSLSGNRLVLTIEAQLSDSQLKASDQAVRQAAAGTGSPAGQPGPSQSQVRSDTEFLDRERAAGRDVPTGGSEALPPISSGQTSSVAFQPGQTYPVGTDTIRRENIDDAMSVNLADVHKGMDDTDEIHHGGFSTRDVMADASHADTQPIIFEHNVMHHAAPVAPPLEPVRELTDTWDVTHDSTTTDGVFQKHAEMTRKQETVSAFAPAMAPEPHPAPAAAPMPPPPPAPAPAPTLPPPPPAISLGGDPFPAQPAVTPLDAAPGFPEPVQPGPSASPRFGGDITLGDDPLPPAWGAGPLPTPFTEEPKPLTETWDGSEISLSDMPFQSNDNQPAISEESAAFGGARHGEPQPTLSFGGAADAGPAPVATPWSEPAGLGAPAPIGLAPEVGGAPEGTQAPAPGLGLGFDLAGPAPDPAGQPAPASPGPVADVAFGPGFDFAPPPAGPVAPPPAPGPAVSLGLEPAPPPLSAEPAPMDAPAPGIPPLAMSDEHMKPGSEDKTVVGLSPFAREAQRPVASVPPMAHPEPAAPAAPAPAPAPDLSVAPSPAASPSANPETPKDSTAGGDKAEPGGTTVLIRYTCPKCKTQGMQAVDKVGTVVNCSNCGKAMRLVMKK